MKVLLYLTSPLYISEALYNKIVKQWGFSYYTEGRAVQEEEENEVDYLPARKIFMKVVNVNDETKETELNFTVKDLEDGNLALFQTFSS